MSPRTLVRIAGLAALAGLNTFCPSDPIDIFRPPARAKVAIWAILGDPVRSGQPTGTVVVGLYASDGTPVSKSGVTLTATSTQPGAILTGATSGVTGANGQATLGPMILTGHWIPGTTYKISIGGAGLMPDVSPALNVVAGLPATLTPTGPLAILGDTSTQATIGVTATDLSGNLVIGQAVRLMPSGGYTVNLQSLVTNGSGVAQGTLTHVGVAGTGTATFDIPARPTVTPVVFNVTTRIPPTIQIASLVTEIAGLPVNPANISGNIVIKLTATDRPAGSQVEVLVDGAPVCQAAPAPAPVEAIDCPVNTAAFDSSTGIPGFRNGPHTVTGRIVAAAQSQTLATTQQPVTFANPNNVVVSETPKVDLTVWRSGSITVSGVPVIYDGPPPELTLTLGEAIFDTSQDLPLPVTHSDFGNGPGNPSLRMSRPYTATLLAARNATVEARIGITGTAFSVGGQILATTPPAGVYTIKLDNLAPRITPITMPGPVTFMAGPAVLLGHTTGPYPAGTTIPLYRISNGLRQPAHPPTCLFEHLHQDITILNPATLAVEGPFTDPSTNGTNDPCGHGRIVNQTATSTLMHARFTTADASFSSGLVRIVRPIGTCDGLILVDDVPILSGTAPGSITPPAKTLPAPGTADFYFTVFGGGTAFVGADFCLRIEATDGATPTPNKSVLVTPFRVVP